MKQLILILNLILIMFFIFKSTFSNSKQIYASEYIALQYDYFDFQLKSPPIYNITIL